MATTDDFPPPSKKDERKRLRRKKKMRKNELEALISTAKRAAHIAGNKGFHIVSPEAIQCVQSLRNLRTLRLTRGLIEETNAFHSVRFLANNGNPKIRSESRSVLDHWRGILDQNHSK